MSIQKQRISIVFAICLTVSLAGCGSAPTIHSAMSEGNDDAALEMIQKGKGINERDHVGNTPLHIASVKGNEKIAHKLVDKGADINARNFDGRTPLMLALLNSHTDLAKFYIKRGAKLKTNYKKTNALLDAAAGGSTEMVGYLLANGFDVNTVDKMNASALHVAARTGDKAMVSYLVNKGIDLDTQTNSNWTAMHFAANGNHLDIVDSLLAFGAKPIINESNGVSTLATGKIFEELAKRQQANHFSQKAKTTYERAADFYSKAEGFYKKYVADTSQQISDIQLKNFLAVVGSVALTFSGPGTTMPNPSGGTASLYTPVVLPLQANGSLDQLKAYFEEREKESEESSQRCIKAAANI